MTNNKILDPCPAEPMTKAEQRVLDILAARPSATFRTLQGGICMAGDSRKAVWIYDPTTALTERFEERTTYAVMCRLARRGFFQSVRFRPDLGHLDRWDMRNERATLPAPRPTEVA